MELEFFRKFCGWVLINKGSENSSINKQVFCLDTLESCLWKLQVIRHNQVYFNSPIILTYTCYTTVTSFNSKSLTMTVVSVKTLEELKLAWLSQIICLFHSLKYEINIDLLQRRIYIFWCLDEKLINNWNMNILKCLQNYWHKMIRKIKFHKNFDVFTTNI